MATSEVFIFFDMVYSFQCDGRSSPYLWGRAFYRRLSRNLRVELVFVGYNAVVNIAELTKVAGSSFYSNFQVSGNFIVHRSHLEVFHKGFAMIVRFKCKNLSFHFYYFPFNFFFVFSYIHILLSLFN
nr:MAG TPA: hypothetical protein [Caudoviricetes sp.]